MGRRRMSRGHWRQRGDKIELRVYVGRDPLTRKKKTETETIPVCGARAADDALAAFVARVRRPVVSSSVTFGELVERWYELRSPKWVPKNVGETRRFIDNYLTPLAPIPIDQIDTPYLDSYYAALRARGGKNARPLAASSVGRIHDVVRAALELAVIYEWLPRNPAAKATTGELDEPEDEDEEAVEPADVRRVLDQAAKSPEWFTFLVLGAVTGARRGELHALRWSRIGEGVMTFSHVISLGPSGPVEVPKRSKNKGRPRTIALGPATSALLTSHRARMAERALRLGSSLARDAYVFSSHADCSKPWYPDSTTHRFRRLCDKLGLAEVHIHSLRHYVSTMGLDEGFPLPTVAGRVGHADGGRMTLSRYAHRRAPTDQALAEFLEGLLGLPGAANG
jgi:integrase